MNPIARMSDWRILDWRDKVRVATLARTAAIMQAMILLFFVAGTHGWLSRGVAPNTTDYASFYAAGRLADQGTPALAYDRDAHLRAEEAATTPGIAYQYFFNPPTYLLIMQPFARLPYLASFALMQALTLAFWLVLATRVAGGGSGAVWVLLAVPSLWWALAEGQNSFLTAGLMAAGTLLLPRRPWLAGLAFGALCYKPHLGLMVPVALLAALQWRAICAAGLTVAAAVAASVALYGAQTWQAFLANAQRSISGPIDTGKVLLAARVDPTGALQFLGMAPGPARILWLLAVLGVVTAVAWLWRRGGREVRSAGLVAATLVAAPFVLMYDLVLACLAAAWLVRAARETGFLPGEKAIIGSVLLLDLFASHPIATAFHLPFGALAGPALLALAVRRSLALPRPGAPGSGGRV
jgi:hypothetical protein